MRDLAWFGGKSDEQRSGAFAGRLLLLPRPIQRINEGAEVLVYALEVRFDCVLRDMNLDRQ